MPKPRPLTPTEAQNSLANRLGIRVAPRLRQFATKFGLRAKRVFLVWTKFTGKERGDGSEIILSRVELLPTPKVLDMSMVTLNPFSAGVLPVGSQRVDKIAITYTMDQLMGKAVPGHKKGQEIEEPFDFYYEIQEDGRGDNPAMIQRFRLLGIPDRREGDMSWSVLLERTSEDPLRNGQSQYGKDVDP
jgi:hypothetical protein